MSKIICDICGTTYPDTAECCPICGCSRDAAAALLGDDLLSEEIVEEPRTRGGRFSSAKKKKEIFDFDEVNAELEEEPVPEEENPYEEEEYEEEPRHNTAAVVLLTVLIAVLLVAAGFLFVRYYLPNLGLGADKEAQLSTSLPEIRETAGETLEPTIPCQGLTLTSGTPELSKEGQYFLLHVIVTPENTTDQLTFASADESIATVTEDGRITAVGEGETVIYITCGSFQYPCPVVCRFVEETLPPETAAPTVPETVPEAVPEGDPDSEGEPAEETAAEEGDSGLRTDVVLKLKQTDFKLGVYLEHQLLLDCDLEQDEVEWSSEHPYIATVDEYGVVKAIKNGTTAITAKYGDQEAKCIVRCG
ncbi:MAG: Ig-like domain-containing protein [Oscillospiraceae bacterium]